MCDYEFMDMFFKLYGTLILFYYQSLCYRIIIYLFNYSLLNVAAEQVRLQ